MDGVGTRLAGTRPALVAWASLCRGGVVLTEKFAKGKTVDNDVCDNDSKPPAHRNVTQGSRANRGNRTSRCRSPLRRPRQWCDAPEGGGGMRGHWEAVRGPRTSQHSHSTVTAQSQHLFGRGVGADEDPCSGPPPRGVRPGHACGACMNWAQHRISSGWVSGRVDFAVTVL